MCCPHVRHTQTQHTHLETQHIFINTIVPLLHTKFHFVTLPRGEGAKSEQCFFFKAIAARGRFVVEGLFFLLMKVLRCEILQQSGWYRLPFRF